jgi:hypothetical protein
MQKLFIIFIIGFTFVALNVVTVVAQTGMIPTADDSAAPIGEGGEGGGPAGHDMSGKMINDGGYGANSDRDDEIAARELAVKEAPCWPPVLNIDMPKRPFQFMQQLGAIAVAIDEFNACIIRVGGDPANHCERLASAVPDRMNGVGNASAKDWQFILKQRKICE